MPKQSAGLFVYRVRDEQRELFLVHPGGPFWSKKDEGAWSIPKGEFEGDEDPLNVACREFTEETGFPISGPFRPLGSVKLSGGKTIHAFAVIAPDLDPTSITSNTFEIEWPPRSGQRQHFPEVDRAAWFDWETARRKIHPGQADLLNRL